METIRGDAAGCIHAVQISDVKRVTLRTMDRALLGKGILPLRAIFRALERGGYCGWYEAEIISDHPERVGYDRGPRQTRAGVARPIRTGARPPPPPPGGLGAPAGAPFPVHPPAGPPR